ncbi:glycosyltransferase family 2 protein [Herbaspirillum sp. AP02]|uniref:glycosyltransferase family 2 protein n=1 Tax=unclassified Herbaspirillum TaxID=2624150 RepID=UPI0015DADF9F|nr:MULTISPECIES: glycosyltransferase family 2 protein [unclassified Herbaspirillum]MBG7620181.1 glycosyltransferase family 2 protein [Herbaspirillum sp. AP02]NZD67645.1 glycosyltransferase family 2 protein [Herbaspirillum sp. AP21]
MPFEACDVDIFVLTYNRSTLLPATLRSLLAQSARGASITVLDNASQDDTQQTVEAFAPEGVTYARASSNLGWAGNLARAQQQARRPWTMVFHDDDLLHPDYLRHALDAINTLPGVGMVVSAMSFETAPGETDWPATEPRSLLCPGASTLAMLCYAGSPIHFGSALYRTDIFKTLRWESDRFGKIADRPFLLAACGTLACQVFLSPLVRYRIHDQQDSTSSDSGPFAPQLAALHHCYRSYLGENPLHSTGRCFLRHNYRCIADEFGRLGRADRARFPTLATYLTFLQKAGACSRFSLVSGKLMYRWQCLGRGLSGLFHGLARCSRRWRRQS